MNFEEVYEKAVRKYEERTPQSALAYEKACKYLAGGETRTVSMYNPYPLTIARGEGCRITDLDGNTYIDFINNYTSLLHGHAHPVITKAICEAAAKGTAAPAGISEQVELASILCERVPCLETVRFCNSGTEATMFAVRAARAYTGRDGIVKIIGGYHGTSDQFEYSCSIPAEKADPTEDYLAIADTKGISLNAGKDVYAVPYNDLNAMEKVLKAHQDKIAAIIVEPFLGAGGVIPATVDYLKGLKHLSELYGIILIFDEVQALRLSTGGAQKRYGVTPDLTAMGKIIGGGLPVGAFGGRREIMEVFDSRGDVRLAASGTFNGNRVTMAAGIASLKLYDEECAACLEENSVYFMELMEKAIKNAGVKACMTRAGSILNVHFTEVPPKEYKESLVKGNKIVMGLVHLKLLEKGIFAAPRGLFVLSTVMTKADLEFTAKSFEEVLKDVKDYI